MHIDSRSNYTLIKEIEWLKKQTGEVSLCINCLWRNKIYLLYIHESTLKNFHKHYCMKIQNAV